MSLAPKCSASGKKFFYVIQQNIKLKSGFNNIAQKSGSNHIGHTSGSSTKQYFPGISNNSCIYTYFIPGKLRTLSVTSAASLSIFSMFSKGPQ